MRLTLYADFQNPCTRQSEDTVDSYAWFVALAEVETAPAGFELRGSDQIPM